MRSLLSQVLPSHQTRHSASMAVTAVVAGASTAAAEAEADSIAGVAADFIAVAVAAEAGIEEAAATGARVLSAARVPSAGDLLAGETTAGAEALVVDRRVLDHPAATEPTEDRTAGSIHRAE